MNKKYITLLVCCFFNNLYSQLQNNNESEVQFLKIKLKQYRTNIDSLEFYTSQLFNHGIEKNIPTLQIDALMSFGGIEARKGNLKRSNDYYYQLISISKESEVTYLIYPAMNNLALNYRRLQRNDSAYFYFTKLRRHYVTNYNPMGMAQVTMNLGISHMQYQKLDSAKYYFSESLRFFQNVKQQRFIPQVLSLLAETNYQQNEYEIAIKLADSSQVLSEKIKMQQNYARNYSLLSRAYEKIGDLKKANYYKELESNLPIRIPPNSIVGRLNEKYEKDTAKRRGEFFNENLNNEKIYKTNLFISLVISSVLVIFVLVFFRRNKIIKNENEQLQVLLNEFKNKKMIVTENNTHNTLILNNKTSLTVDSLLYVKSDGHYAEFYIKGEENPLVDRNRMKAIEELLPEKQFMRIHKSYIINLEEIKILNSTQIMISNGTWIPISRTYKEKLKLILYKK